jgi:spermine oxidase
MAGLPNGNDSDHNNMNRSFKVVIIGAGISAIAAANMLCSEGVDDLVILEATDRIGGRIWSIDLETDMGHKVELGANWIHGIELNPIYKIAIANNLLSNQYAGRHLGKKMMFMQENGDPVNGRIVQDVDLVYGMLMSECEDFYKQQIPTPYEDDSVGAYVEREFEERIRRYPAEERRLRRACLNHRFLGECVISGANSLNDIALSEVGSFEELPGIHYVIPPGFESVVHILGQNIPSSCIRLNHVVNRISWDNHGESSRDRPVCIECSNGKKFFADVCLVTISLGYLKQHGDRLFTPPLPSNKNEAMQRIAMGTVNKIILEFDGQILPDDVFRLECVWNRENIENEDMADKWVKKIGSFEAVADNVLMGWLSGDEAVYMESLTDEQVGAKCVSAITGFLSKSRPVPNLKKVTRSFWRTNPYTLGAYCHIPVGASVEDIHTISEPVYDSTHKAVLLFAGEATHPTFYSSAHGSMLSGQREARRILDQLGH